MNLVEVLRSRIDDLPDGDHTLGVKAVLSHIEVAVRHFERGRDSQDETAFTDAIYRTNQAFEGSLKEAYRVLTGKNPARKTPNSIEEYLERENVLKPRVLSQLTIYRQDWRNPSAHDFWLVFNQDEALLAIFTVSAFAIVLMDQISQCLAAQQARLSAASLPVSPSSGKPLAEQFIDSLPQFLNQFNTSYLSQSNGELGAAKVRETEIIGALEGFLASVMPDLTVKSEYRVPESSARIDLLLSNDSEQVIVEIKRATLKNSAIFEQATTQAAAYMAMTGVKRAVVLSLPVPNAGILTTTANVLMTNGGEITVVTAEPDLDKRTLVSNFDSH